LSEQPEELAALAQRIASSSTEPLIRGFELKSRAHDGIGGSAAYRAQ
jgi:hypothetical protein